MCAQVGASVRGGVDTGIDVVSKMADTDDDKPSPPSTATAAALTGWIGVSQDIVSETDRDILSIGVDGDRTCRLFGSVGRFYYDVLVPINEAIDAALSFTDIHTADDDDLHTADDDDLIDQLCFAAYYTAKKAVGRLLHCQIQLFLAQMHGCDDAQLLNIRTGTRGMRLLSRLWSRRRRRGERVDDLLVVANRVLASGLGDFRVDWRVPTVDADPGSRNVAFAAASVIFGDTAEIYRALVGRYVCWRQCTAARERWTARGMLLNVCREAFVADCVSIGTLVFNDRALEEQIGVDAFDPIGGVVRALRYADLKVYYKGRPGGSSRI